MRRPLVVVGVVVIVAVVAVPAVRRSVAGRLDAVRDSVRDRVTAFREDYATREAELRTALLPEPGDVTAAERRYAEAHGSVEPY